jgi:GNAT superfamily N-acetyltransferase
MTLHVHDVRDDRGGKNALLSLLCEYEESLPVRLRHGAIARRTVTSMMALPHRAILAAEGDDAVGCLMLTHLDTSTAVLQRLYVKPTSRGAGVGRALVQHVTALARDSRYKRVTLDTDAEALPAASQLYRSLGFVPCEAFMRVSYDNAQFMELRLY